MMPRVTTISQVSCVGCSEIAIKTSGQFMHMTSTAATNTGARWFRLHKSKTLSSGFVLYISMQILGVLIALTIDRGVF